MFRVPTHMGSVLWGDPIPYSRPFLLKRIMHLTWFRQQKSLLMSLSVLVQAMSYEVSPPKTVGPSWC